MNIFIGVIESCDRGDSHAWLKLGRGRLAARRWVGMRRGAKATVRVRPEDVLLCAGHPGRISARNVMPGHVKAVKAGPDGVFVTVDVGFPLVAVVTKGAVRELRLARGAAVYAIVKATAIVPEQAMRPRWRASVVGRRGVIGYERLDLLRALAKTGSISAAAKEIRVTFRTAWLWTESMNADWGAPLVTRSRGGKGGGGALLTPAGRSVLRQAERVERCTIR